MLVGLGHHRVGEHGEDRAGHESEDEGDGVRRRVLEEAIADERREPRDERDGEPEKEDTRRPPAARSQPGGRRIDSGRFEMKTATR